MKNSKIDTSINWAILCTGWGRNATDLIEAYTNGALKASKIKVVIYESEPCGAAEIAKIYRIPTFQIQRKDFSSSSEYQQNIIHVLQNHKIDFLFLLNYKYLIQKEMLLAFPKRILNIHPSLFPSFLGTKTAIQDAISYGVKITGITTHIIDHEYDKGIIICQHPIKVKSNDTFDSLYPKFVKNGIKIILKTIRKIEKNI
ncbi:phosphoribosylglycinamide formyltransferase-1 [Arenibacter nanhaiticus]|uniref:phosphoribosylglycinamide formyltransferase 1 n=1 Tax=Arenibacter nanhaiticus TaxID=558155 RepID=A0A1M6KLI5_9FLAO|nr:formyltransferase family protein [Arenibacter nanhaiticus]SHJ59823.1 phosphoribosylglycinamide formyltransferase-1 [Arenibacter nanhaiticus]